MPLHAMRDAETDDSKVTQPNVSDSYLFDALAGELAMKDGGRRGRGSPHHELPSRPAGSGQLVSSGQRKPSDYS